VSAAAKGKQLLKNKVVGPAVATTPAATSGAQSAAAAAATTAAAAPVATAAGPSAAQLQQLANLEKEVSQLRAELEAAKIATEEANKRVAEEKKKAAEEAKKVVEEQRRTREAQEEIETERERRVRAEAAARQWEGEGCEDITDLNELRELKHKLKGALERVQNAVNQRKACPSCEVAVKDCIVVPCLHAFCQKCGERNKKQVKCSVCGVAPERIYLLGKK
jgi:DNA repair exonuclease SbcCD ATPase subunit